LSNPQVHELLIWCSYILPIYYPIYYPHIVLDTIPYTTHILSSILPIYYFIYTPYNTLYISYILFRILSIYCTYTTGIPPLVYAP
jgi:hypothetical protein